MPPFSPSLTNRTLPAQNRVKEDEPEYAVEVKKDERQYDKGEDSDQDQSNELRDVLGNVCGDVCPVEGRENIRQARGKKLAIVFLWDTRPTAAEVRETASADMQFSCQNSNQRQSGPLPEAETSEELFARVLQGGLDGIDGGDGHGITSNQRRKGIALRLAASMAERAKAPVAPRGIIHSAAPRRDPGSRRARRESVRSVLRRTATPALKS